jgi:hypothetical protein
MTMKTSTTVRIISAVSACVFAAQLSAGLVASGSMSAAADLKVTIKYTGKGTVDASHRIWVWVFDTPNITAGSIPIAELSLEKNGGEAAFSALSADKVWIAVAYDVAGGFTGSAPPPSGAPVAIQADAKGVPTVVATGDKARVTVSFDDTQKMP